MSALTSRNSLPLALLLAIVSTLACGADHPATVSGPPPPPPPPPPPWQLVWHDEFDSTALDTTRWTWDIGGNGWGNAELEYYTNRVENARVDSGALVIEARQESFGGQSYTSARLKTQGLGAWKYGRVEARIQIPRGQGLWPAFWMLGDNIAQVGWPACGEIDIMENIGKEPAIVHGTAHGPGYSGANGIGAPYTLSTGAFADNYHVYAIEWQPGSITWSVDSIPYETVSSSQVPGTWVFDHPFFIILNVAVGGYWPGSPDGRTVFPQTMRVDYVRVYQR